MYEYIKVIGNQTLIIRNRAIIKLNTRRLTMDKEGKYQQTKKVTISPEQLEKEIHERAKEIFLSRNEKEGDALSDWLQAEKEIKKKYNLN
jgi:Protein of unknown function (DUF2934)